MDSLSTQIPHDIDCMLTRSFHMETPSDVYCWFANLPLDSQKTMLSGFTQALNVGTVSVRNGVHELPRTSRDDTRGSRMSMDELMMSGSSVSNLEKTNGIRMVNELKEEWERVRVVRDTTGNRMEIDGCDESISYPRFPGSATRLGANSPEEGPSVLDRRGESLSKLDVESPRTRKRRVRDQYNRKNITIPSLVGDQTMSHCVDMTDRISNTIRSNRANLDGSVVRPVNRRLERHTSGHHYAYDENYDESVSMSSDEIPSVSDDNIKDNNCGDGGSGRYMSPHEIRRDNMDVGTTGLMRENSTTGHRVIPNECLNEDIKLPGLITRFHTSSDYADEFEHDCSSDEEF